MSGVTRKQLGRHKGRAGGEVKTFAMKPSEVLRSEAHCTLPFTARVVLEALADQYRGHNNGSLTLTRYTSRDYGISNPYALDESFRELEARGLIIETRPGTRPVGTLRARSAMFALTWWKMDPPDPDDPHQATPTIHPPDTWRSWRASKRGMHWTVKRRDRSEERGREKTRPFDKKPSGQNRSPVYPGDTKSGIPGIQQTPPSSIPGIPQRVPDAVSRGYASDISGVGGTGNPKEMGGEAGRGALVVPQPVAAGLGAADSERAAWYRGLLNRVREKASKVPRGPRRLGKPHLQYALWQEAIFLCAEGTAGMDGKSIAMLLGRLVSKYGWHRFEILVQECEVLALWGLGALTYIEGQIRIPLSTTSNDERADSAGWQVRDAAPAGSPVQ